MSPQQRIGLTGEQWAFDKLKSMGYSVTAPNQYFLNQCDLKINGCPVEVKIAYAKPHPRNKKRFRYQWGVQNLTSDNGEFILILIAVTPVGAFEPFIMPGSIMAQRSSPFEINSRPDIYKGMIAKYYKKWSYVDLILQDWQKAQGQLGLWENLEELS